MYLQPTLDLPTRTPLEQPLFLPTTQREMLALGWSHLDILLVSGDAYLDHPSFGIPLLGRWLVAHGFKVGIVAQPAWSEQGLATLSQMGRPSLFAGLSAGAMDSMLAHYTAFRKKRHADAYTPGGGAGARPNRAVIVYANLLRRAFPGLPLIAGGIEASLRRFTHYDFWEDKLRRSILLDARLDALVLGMGELPTLEIARRLDWATEQGHPVASLAGIGLWSNIPGTARNISSKALVPTEDLEILPSHEDILSSAEQLLVSSLQWEAASHQNLTLAQNCGDRTILAMPLARPLNTEELDSLYALPFTRQAHPNYTEAIPALEMMATSLTTHRGCGGGCSFCALALHQGRRISSRSKDSILNEALRLQSSSISDVGGPTANMWGATCQNPKPCARSSCMFPQPCPFFQVNQKAWVQMLRSLKNLPHIKHVRIASGVRYDLALQDKDAMAAYIGEFTGGQLKVAPEHCSPDVLTQMRKPNIRLFELFLQAFVANSQKYAKEQYTVPYLMSAFPGCTDRHMLELKNWLQAKNWSPKQVQCFIPTPGTVATAMYYSQLDPQGNPIFVARTDAKRLRQHGILLG